MSTRGCPLSCPCPQSRAPAGTAPLQGSVSSALAMSDQLSLQVASASMALLHHLSAASGMTHRRWKPSFCIKEGIDFCIREQGTGSERAVMHQLLPSCCNLNSKGRTSICTANGAFPVPHSCKNEQKWIFTENMTIKVTLKSSLSTYFSRLHERQTMWRSSFN